MGSEHKPVILDALWRERMHIEPLALDLSPPRVRAAYGEQIWEPPRRLRPYLAALPTGLLEMWRAAGRGHLVYTHGASGYAPGPQSWQGQTFHGVCTLSVSDIVLAPKAALAALCNLLDHLLGSGGDPEGGWFSERAGITPPLEQAAACFGRIHGLGYGHAELDAHTPRDYLARTWALYLTEPRRLNVLDPQVYRLYRNVLMSEAFWARE